VKRPTPILLRRSLSRNHAIESEQLIEPLPDFDDLIEIRKPDGTIYRVALGEFGAPILCTCPGHRNRGTCKHEDMVIDAMLGNGIPFRKGGRLVILPGVGLVEDGRLDSIRSAMR
jgi:hypothetical protein